MFRKPKIGFVYFDLGNVVIRVRKDIVEQEFEKVSELPREEIAWILSRGYVDDNDSFWALVRAFDRGDIYPHDFFKQTRDIFKLEDIGFEGLEKIWQKMLELDWRFFRLVARLERLGVRRGIISDLCILHYNGLESILPQDLFNIRFFSFVERRLKKENDGQTFLRAISAAGITPDKILFVDDVEANIEAAARHGMRAFHYQDNFGDLLAFLRLLKVKI